MTFGSRSLKAGASLCAFVFTIALIGEALAQPPKPSGGRPGGGPSTGPGTGPGAPGPGPGGPGPGPGPGTLGGAPSPTFVLRMCNKTNDVPVAFVATASVVGQQFRAQGWTQVPKGQCVPVGTFQRPTVWWHGRAPAGTTWGEKFDVDLCVNLNAGFDYTWGGSGRTCGQGETSVPFMKLEIAPNVNAFDMNLN